VNSNSPATRFSRERKELTITERSGDHQQSLRVNGHLPQAVNENLPFSRERMDTVRKVFALDK